MTPIREHRRDRDLADPVHEPLHLTRLPRAVKEARGEGRRSSLRPLDHALEDFERHIMIIALRLSRNAGWRATVLGQISIE